MFYYNICMDIYAIAEAIYKYHKNTAKIHLKCSACGSVFDDVGGCLCDSCKMTWDLFLHSINRINTYDLSSTSKTFEEYKRKLMLAKFE